MSNSGAGQAKTFRVKDLRKGNKVQGEVLLVETSNFKQTRNQKYFIQMSLRDCSGAIKAIRWEASPELYSSFGVNDFLRIRGRVEEFQGQLQLIVDGLDRVSPESVDFRNFLPVTKKNIDELEKALHAAVEEVGHPKIQSLLREIVKDPKIRAGLRHCPAGKSLHHAYVGGLLEHIVSMLGAIKKLTTHYTHLNRDILYAGAILHDIGKVEELCYTSNFSYTDAGQLVGHLGIGLMIVTEKAKSLGDIPEDLLLEIQHIIASHHGIPEYGTLKLPMTAEAIALHYLDNLDAKLASLEAMEDELPPEDEEGRETSSGRWSDYKPHLSRKVFFPKRTNT